jgi:hypothetical protein
MGRASGTTRAKLPSADSIKTVLDALVAESEAEQRRVAAFVVELNTLLAEEDRSNDRIADLLVDRVFGGDVTRALSPRSSPPMAWRLLGRAAGRDLKLGRQALSRFLRIGALGRRLGRPWGALDWSVRLELLPLAGDAENLSTLLAAAERFHGAPAPLRAVRAWVRDHGAAAVPDRVRRRGPTFRAGRAWLRVGAGVSRAVRHRWLAHYEALEAQERAAVRADLDACLKALTALKAEMENDDRR